MKKRLGAVILILALVVSLLPAVVLADEAGPAEAEAAGTETLEGTPAEEPAAEEPVVEEPVVEDPEAGPGVKMPSQDEPISPSDAAEPPADEPQSLPEEGASFEVPLMGASHTLVLEATEGGRIEGKGVSSSGVTTRINLAAGETLDLAEMISQGRLKAGSTLTLKAIPEPGYAVKGWYRHWHFMGPQLWTTSKEYSYKMPTDYDDDLTAVFTDETEIKSVYFTVNVPAAGRSAPAVDAASRISIQKSYHFHVYEADWFEVFPNSSPFDDVQTKPFSGTFETGRTYYLRVILMPDEDYHFLDGSENGQMTSASVYGATLHDSRLLVSREYNGSTLVREYGVVRVSFTPETPIALPNIVITPPYIGQSTSDISAAESVWFLNDDHYQLQSTPYWSKNNNGSIGSPFEGTFEEGVTYYLCTRMIQTESGCFWDTDSNGLKATPVTGGTYALHTTARSGINGIIAYDPIIAFTPRPAPPSNVLRLYGSNRYKTSLSIAAQLKKEMGGGKFNSIVLATGENYPDALAGGYLATVKNAPIILIRTGKPTSHKDNQMVAKWIKSNLKSGGTIYVLGSTAAVPKSHVDLVKSGFKVKRLEGKNRFGTNAAILNEIGTSGINEVIVTTGRDFPDALCASALDKPLLIVETKQSKQKLDTAQKAYLGKLKNPTFYIVGPTSVVPKTFETQLAPYGTVKRIAEDKNAMTRSVQIAETLCPKPGEAALAVVSPYPDGLCGGVIANRHNAPLLLVKKGSESRAASYVKENKLRDGLVFGANKDTVVPDGSVIKILPEAKIVSSEYK